MDAVTLANQQFELQRNAFIFADIKTELLESFQTKPLAYVYHEDDDGFYYSEINTKTVPIYDDKMTASFKVGDNFYCKVRQNSKELWFQIKNNKTFINLRDPSKYFKRQIDGVDYYIFVALTGLYIVMLLPQVLELPKAKAMLSKMSKSIISYDKHGQVMVKRGVE
ncbi:hypothetical protein V0M98_38000 (plasmid) [Pseudomonas silesiensis]|uniref:hypothetical protein n=1 Tax=Pseudomonas silesiensis TaxID=1853130 RepID=UPI0030CC1A4F